MSYRPLLRWCWWGAGRLWAWGGEKGGGFSTICSPPAQWGREGVWLFSYLAVFLFITRHKHRSLRCAGPEQAVNAASPIQPLSEWTRASTAHTSFLSGCTCPVGPRGSTVCLSCCCCVDGLFFFRSSSASVMASLWHTVVNLTLKLPSLCVHCIPLNFCIIQLRASYAAESATADHKAGPVRKPKSPRWNYFHSNLYKKSTNCMHHKKTLQRNLPSEHLSHI